MTRQTDLSIDSKPSRIQACEQRLALSASMAGEMLMEALNIGTPDQQEGPQDNVIPDTSDLGVETQSFEPNSIASNFADGDSSPDLVNQAAELRNTYGLDGSGQTVAVIDSGVAWDHVALGGGGFGPGYRVVGGWDFAENDADPYDDGPAGYHGTHVAGVLAGQTNDYAGVAPEADIVALRVFDDNGAGQLQWIESALQWVNENQDAFDSPITTVNLSVGAALNEANRAEAMEMLEDELAALRENNILVFAASGNLFASSSGEEGVLYPASSPSVVAVASVDDGGDLSDFAQRESGVFATRGESIDSAVPDHVFGWDGKVDDFAPLDGTSMATPQIAAASMLVRQAMIEQGLEPTADEILARLRDSAVERVDSVTGATYHTVDLEAAIGDVDTSQPDHVIDHFDGTNSSERLELDLREGIQLRVGGMTYMLESGNNDAPLVIDVGGGDDSLKIIGSENAERLVIRPPSGDVGDASSSISTNHFKIELRGFENILFEGGGGPDRASLFDSPGSDQLRSEPGHSTLTGAGFQFDVLDVPRVYVHGTSGGNDTAFLYDGAGDDNLFVRPQFTSLRGDDSFQLAYGFERVYAYANAGGHDSAQLYDSAGDDTMSISSGRSMIAGVGYQVSARGFESTEGHAVSGGHDVARLYADETSNRWRVTDDMVQWTGQDNDVRIARGFERTEAFENYEPIRLTPQSLNSPNLAWLNDDLDDRANREAEASRAIFEHLGKEE